MRAFTAVRAWYDAHPLALDLTLVAIVTAVAGALRLTLLGEIPFGVNPDEAQLGTDAYKIMDGQLIGVYTHAALGQPAGHSYFTLPSIWLLGGTAFALRLPLALAGLAAVPLLYALVRLTLGRIEAFFASAMLAVSYWHLLYSRVAHWSISYGTVLLAALLCLVLGMRSRRRAWFVASGAILGLGVYTYNIYPIAVVAFAASVAIITFVHYRGAEWRWWRGSILALFAVALIVALPMIIYVARPSSYYWKHVNNYGDVSITRTRAYKDASVAGKARLIAGQAGTFAKAYTWDGQQDVIDASGLRPTFDVPTLVLLAAGLVIAVRRRREPMIIVALCAVAIIPLPAVTQQGSMTRQPLGAAPYAMLIAALPLAWVWRGALAARPRWRILAMTAVAVTLALITTITVRDYFWTWRRDSLVRFVYHAEISAASDYMRTLSSDDQILFYSDRHPFNLETRQFLAPDVVGTDRSSEFSAFDGSIKVFDRTRPVVFVLLGRYRALLPDLRSAYPEGRAVTGTHDGVTEFVAYELPAVPN